MTEVIEVPDPEPTTMVKFAVIAVVREALFNLPDDPSKVTIGGQRRQIMARAFPYIDVKTASTEALLDQLGDDIRAAMVRMTSRSSELEESEAETTRQDVVDAVPSEFQFVGLGYAFVDDLAEFVRANADGDGESLGQRIGNATHAELSDLDERIADRVFQEEEYSLAVLYAAEEVFGQ